MQWFLIDWDVCLGGGGEGEVYLARSLQTTQLCAIKISNLTDPEAAREQLTEELERYTRAAGDGVVDLIAWNLDSTPPFLAFELAPAGTLADEIAELCREGSAYHPVGALHRTREILRSVAQMHERGLIHRDVKPGNLLRFGDRIKLADFGTARSVDRPAAAANTSQIGTRLYAAPEQLEERPVDASADLYSVGCVLHELLTGHVPERPFGELPELSSLILPELDALLTRLLSEQPDHRPSAEEAIREVDSILRSYEAVEQVWQRLDLGSAARS